MGPENLSLIFQEVPNCVHPICVLPPGQVQAEECLVDEQDQDQPQPHFFPKDAVVRNSVV